MRHQQTSIMSLIPYVGTSIFKWANLPELSNLYLSTAGCLQTNLDSISMKILVWALVLGLKLQLMGIGLSTQPRWKLGWRVRAILTQLLVGEYRRLLDEAVDKVSSDISRDS